ncbi:MAG: beta-N-acetylhexosaminidase [Actinomycetota bacterium]|nr:beta-N-acetylhexosaminidase [Actinomycetota bacterium]
MVGLIAAILSVFIVPSPEPRAAPPPPPPAAAPRPALTLRQAVGQRMVFAYDGLSPPPALRRRIRRGEAAGVIVFSRNVRSATRLRATVRSLQAIKRPTELRAPLIVMTDQESGPVRRIPGPPPSTKAQTRSVATARADGRATARTLRRAGVNMDLAPVADVGRPGAALVRERRTHGSSARRVARLVTAFATGLRTGGVLATGKHFPGLGASRVNTDAAPARIGLSLSALRSVDAVAFASLIAADIDAIMLATAVYPALDERPAAFSGKWVRGELRERLGFRGVTISDDLQTPAVQSFGSISERAVRAAKAGIDVPLFVGNYRAGTEAAEGLVAAGRTGELSRAGLERTAKRVLRLRERLKR